MNAVVTVSWLAENLLSPTLRLFDASFYLPTENKDPQAEFRRAHIPGAHFFDIGVVADPDTDLPHMVPTPGRFERLMRAMGVSDDSLTVFYDQKGINSAPRGWWLMGLFGHDQAAVLDGGLPAWRASGHGTNSGDPAPPLPGSFTATLRTARLRGIGDMQNTNELVLDARVTGRFDGTAPEPRTGLPSGHMPGARNLPIARLMQPDGTLLPPDRLRQAFAAAGDDGSRPVVTSCGSGVTATVLTLARVQAGLPIGAVYDGSWTEWASRPDTIKETN